MINCYNSEYKKNILKCATSGEKCDPRVCQGCTRLSTTNFYTEVQAINELLDYCEQNCPKYYKCDRVAELNDKLKKHEERI